MALGIATPLRCMGAFLKDLPFVALGLWLSRRKLARACVAVISIGCGSGDTLPSGERSGPAGPFSCETVSGNWKELTLPSTGLPDARLTVAQVLGTRRASAKQVIRSGVASRSSELRLPLTCRHTRLLAPEQLAFLARVASPGEDADQDWALEVQDARVEGGALVMRVDGPVSEGSLLRLSDAQIAVEGSGVVATAATEGASLRLSGDGFATPREAARWFKAFQPTDVELFPSDTYGSAPLGEPLPAPPSESEVSAALASHYHAKVARGMLRRARADELLALFARTLSGAEPVVSEIFAAPDGAPRLHLLAATLATAGTVLESAIDAVLFGENVSGRPFRVVYSGEFDTRLPSGASAAMYTKSDGRLWLVAHPSFQGESFAALAPTVGHEAFHQDTLNGREEEACAKVAESIAWAQMLLAEPELARARTQQSRSLNLEVLWLLNSGGRAFPSPGFYSAPLAERSPNVHPSSARQHASFEAVIDEIYQGIPERATPGNAHLAAVARQLLGGHPGLVAFDSDTLSRVFDDASRVLTPDAHFELLTILGLRSVSGRDAAEPQESRPPG